MKYPTIPDYRLSISELDQKEYLGVRLGIVDLRLLFLSNIYKSSSIRNNYAILFDMIQKNLDKIQKPRGSANLDHVY